MASEYGFITLANLEAFAGLDYSAINAKYTDAIIEAQISIAERFVRVICKDSPTSATDGIYTATCIMAKRLMHQRLVEDKYQEPETKTSIEFFDNLINIVLEADTYSPAGAIPMQGIDR